MAGYDSREGSKRFTQDNEGHGQEFVLSMIGNTWMILNREKQE